MWSALVAWFLRWWEELFGDPIRAIRVTVVMAGTYRHFPCRGGRHREEQEAMWTPIDKIELGETCSLRAIGTKKSGAKVTLAPDRYVATDGDAVQIVDGIVTGLQEGVANIEVSLVGDPSVWSNTTLTVADPIIELSVSTGREVVDPVPEPAPGPEPEPEPDMG